MRSLRLLKPGVWYEVITRINNREPLFRRYSALAIFVRIFREANLLFAFEIRRLHLEDDLLRFYIKPKDGLELPAIMKWMKQVFAQRFNREDGRTGHIWGDRYGSRILEGEPMEEEREETGERVASNFRVRPSNGEEAVRAFFPRIFPFFAPSRPG